MVDVGTILVLAAVVLVAFEAEIPAICAFVLAIVVYVLDTPGKGFWEQLSALLQSNKSWVVLGGACASAWLVYHSWGHGPLLRSRAVPQTDDAVHSERGTAGPKETNEKQEEEARARQNEQGRSSDDSAEGAWWDVLAVSPHAPLDEITRSYREKIKAYHPDRLSGLGPDLVALAERRTKALNIAFAQAKSARSQKVA